MPFKKNCLKNTSARQLMIKVVSRNIKSKMSVNTQGKGYAKRTPGKISSGYALIPISPGDLTNGWWLNFFPAFSLKWITFFLALVDQFFFLASGSHFS